MSIPSNYLRAVHRQPAQIQPARNWPDNQDYAGTCRKCGQMFKGERGRTLGRYCYLCAGSAGLAGIVRPVIETPPAPVASDPRRSVAGFSAPRKRKAMNKTETAFAAILEARKLAGEISDWFYEGITLRLPDGMTLTPDFAVWMKNDDDLFVWHLMETKGAWIEEDALVKFRAFRHAFNAQFEWELWQQVKWQWKKIL